MKIQKLTFILLVFLLFLNFQGNCQDPINFKETIMVNGVDKGELYKRAKHWFVIAYKSPKDVLQLDDEDGGEIIGKAVLTYDPTIFSGSTQTRGVVRYTVKIFLKDGRFKYEFTDFIHDPFRNQYNQYGKLNFGLITTDIECPNPRFLQKNWSNRVWDDIKEQINENIKLLVQHLEIHMKMPIETSKDNW
jgi:hypothetical protein